MTGGRLSRWHECRGKCPGSSGSWNSVSYQLEAWSTAIKRLHEDQFAFFAQECRAELSQLRLRRASARPFVLSRAMDGVGHPGGRGRTVPRQDTDATALVKKIQSARTAEIALMQRMLQK